MATEGTPINAVAAEPGTASAPPANNSPAPSSGTPTPGVAGAAPQSMPGDWTTNLSPEFQNFVQNKGFKDPGSIVESYWNLEKLIGSKESLIKLPEKADAPEWKDVYAKLGKPAKAEEYNIKGVEGGDPKFLEFAKGMFHEANLTGKQAEALTAKWNDYIKTQNEGATTAQNNKMAEDVAGLKKEWGAAYSENETAVNTAATKLGLNADQLIGLRQALGPAGAMKFLHNVSTRLGMEPEFRSGDQRSTFGTLTPGQAQARIAQIRSGKDPEFTKKFLSKDLSAVEEMNRLHRWANGDE